MTSAIVLAAGMSTRMGTLKQLLPFGKSTVLGSVIENLQAARISRIVVVLGHEADKVREALAAFRPWNEGAGTTPRPEANDTSSRRGSRSHIETTAAASSPVQIVLNEEYVLGMFSSVQAGLRALTTDTETLLICLGDQPGIRGATIQALLEQFAACGKGIGIPFADRDQGHPLFISGKYRNELQLMAPTLTLKHFLSSHAYDIARLPVEDTAILRDIDTQAEYENERHRYDCGI